MKLVSTKEEFAVATTTLSVPASIDRDGLDKLGCNSIDILRTA